MSDDEYEFDYSDDEGGFGGEEEEGKEGEEDLNVKIQNEFYSAKGNRESDPVAAMEGFKQVMAIAEQAGTGHKNAAEFGEWAFKAAKNIVKLHARSGNVNEMLSSYKALLQRVNSGGVTRNRAEKAINSILDLVSAGIAGGATITPGNQQGMQMQVDGGTGSSAAAASQSLQEFFVVTLQTLTGASGNDRLAFKTQMKLARLYLSQGDWKALRALLSELEAGLTASSSSSSSSSSLSSSSSSGLISEVDRSKSTQLLEVYCMQIQLCSSLGEPSKRLLEIYRRAEAVSRTAVPHPSIAATLHEAGGKIKMGERDWEGARLEFLEAFKSYEEAGSGERTLACLRYMLVANLLSGSSTGSRINPFDSQETKAYEKEQSIAGLTLLTEAYLKNDIAAFEPLLASLGSSSSSSSPSNNNNGAGAGGAAGPSSKNLAGTGASSGVTLVIDDFMRPYLGDLLSSIRTKVLLSIVGPYTRILMSTLAADLHMSAAETEELCVQLILDGRLAASIDQVAGVLVLKPQPPAAPPATTTTTTSTSTSTAAKRGSSSSEPLGLSTSGFGSSSSSSSSGTSAAASSRYREISFLASRLSNLLDSLQNLSLSASSVAAAHIGEKGSLGSFGVGGGGQKEFFSMMGSGRVLKPPAGAAAAAGSRATKTMQMPGRVGSGRSATAGLGMGMGSDTEDDEEDGSFGGGFGGAGAEDEEAQLRRAIALSVNAAMPQGRVAGGGGGGAGAGGVGGPA